MLEHKQSLLTKVDADCLHSSIYKYSDSAIFPNSRANNSGCSGPICPKIELIRDLMAIYIVAKFGTDWSVFADARQSQIWQFF